MQVLILILIVIAVAVAAGAFLAMRRKPQAPVLPPPSSDTESRAPTVPAPPPMNDLEAALSQVTDSTGRPMRDHIDAETEHVDELRIPDDTGPLLRRALDHVEKPADDDTPATGPDGAGDQPSDENGAAPER